MAFSTDQRCGWAGLGQREAGTSAGRANSIYILVCQKLIFNYRPAKMVRSVCMLFHLSSSLPSHETASLQEGPPTLAAEYHNTCVCIQLSDFVSVI